MGGGGWGNAKKKKSLEWKYQNTSNEIRRKFRGVNMLLSLLFQLPLVQVIGSIVGYYLWRSNAPRNLKDIISFNVVLSWSTVRQWCWKPVQDAWIKYGVRSNRLISDVKSINNYSPRRRERGGGGEEEEEEEEEEDENEEDDDEKKEEEEEEEEFIVSCCCNGNKECNGCKFWSTQLLIWAVIHVVWCCAIGTSVWRQQYGSLILQVFHGLFLS
ncbi:hypothetical protein RFI_23375, partial [Reticulomyxa filosa]